jgi:hypothetical protein
MSPSEYECRWQILLAALEWKIDVMPADWRERAKLQIDVEAIIGPPEDRPQR